MTEINTSNHQKQHDFFLTLKRYAERLNEEKNLSLSYLQTINKLSVQINQKDETIERLLKQNQELKEKLSLYEQVMARSRIMLSSANKNIQNHSTMAIDGNTKNNVASSPRNSYSNLKFSRLIGKQKFTQSFVQTRNQLDYLKEYDQEAYQKLSHKLNNHHESFLIQGPKEDNTIEINTKQKVFPIFQDFIIFKPTQNINSSPDKLTDLKLTFSLSNLQIKKGNKLFQSISTYLCHNKGPQWQPQQYKPQIIINKTSISIGNNNTVGSFSQNNSNHKVQLTDDIFIYLSNSQQTLKPIVHSADSDLPISLVYQQFNPSLYYFGFCYKSHCLEYINGKLYKVPLIYSFITRYPFLSSWRQLLVTVVERLNLKNDNDMLIFRNELQSLKAKSSDQIEGIVVSSKKSDKNNSDFKFSLLNKQFKWKKIFCKSKLKEDLLSPLKHQGVINKGQKPRSRQRYYSLQLPFQNQNQLSEIVLKQIAPSFASYSIQLIIDVLLLLLLEIPIAIISKSQSLLQKFMLYFVYIIKPLKYPFPIIFNLPPTMAVVLESPFPSFLGLTDTNIIEPYMFERTVFDLDQKVAKSWPNIDFYNNSRECVVKWISKFTQNEQNQISKLERINQIVKILISSSKHYPEELKQLRTYRKYFKKTQIWHLYSHSREQIFKK